jgi:hypothetical protein
MAEDKIVSISDQQTVDVLAIRKLELLLDVMSCLENANAPELYGVKLTVIDKIERIVSNL